MSIKSSTQSLIILLFLVALAPCCLAEELFTEESITYTGGPYKNEIFKYRLLKPEKIEKDKAYPLVLLLHGAGGRGDNNKGQLRRNKDSKRQLRYIPNVLLSPEMRKKHPCFILVPQCRRGKKWVNASWGAKTSSPTAAKPSDQMQAAILALQKTVRQNPVDINRIYLTGMSMGGYGSWELATRYPQWFAAVVPICGGGDERLAHRLTELPLWAFHGDKDKTVPVCRSRIMVKAIRKAGGKPQYTEVKNAGHTTWPIAYKANVIEWMFKHNQSPAKDPLPGLTALAGPTSPLREKERIVFLGDSITLYGTGKFGFITLIGNAIRENKPKLGATVIPAGHSGHKVSHLHKRFVKDVITANASIVFIYIGINDVWYKYRKQATPKDKYEKLLKDMITRCQKQGIVVILATPGLIGERIDGGNLRDAILDEYAAISRKVAAETGAGLCDLRKEFIEALKIRNPRNRSKNIFTRDMVHLNFAGNRFLADKAAMSIAEMLQKQKNKSNDHK